VSGKSGWWSIMVTAVGVLVVTSLISARAVIWFRRNALLNCPRAYIGRSAVYCGGIFNFWGSQLRGLQSVRLLPGHTPEHPGLVEFIIGWSAGARRAANVIDAATLLAMRPAYASSQSARQVIPIPPGEESRAAEIVTLLRTPEHTAPIIEAEPRISRHPVVAVAPALSGVHHEPRSLRQRAIRWLVVTVVLLFGGLGLFLLAIPLDSGRAAGAQPSSRVTFIEVVGLFAWVLSPATLIMSIVQWLRSRHTRGGHYR
jgi:hypothetical protein